MALILGAAVPVAAHASSPVFSGPVAIARGGADPQTYGGFPPELVVGLDGRATVAWLGVDPAEGEPPTTGRGVFVSERQPGGGSFSAPLKLSDDNWIVKLARNEPGMRAVAWSGPSGPDGTPKLSLAPPGAGFGPAEVVPLPPRLPPTQSNVAEPSRWIGLSSLSVAPDGTVLVGYLDHDVRAESQRAVVALRRPGGTWSEPQIIGEGLQDAGPIVAADGTGGLHAVWTAPHDGSAHAKWAVHSADAGPGGAFGPDRVLSGADRATANGSAKLIANRRGDTLVVWETGFIATEVEARLRPAGGDWLPVRVFTDENGNGTRPTGALDEEGDALVAWTDGNAHASFRPAGGDWGAQSDAFARQGSIQEMPSALDAEGAGLVVSAVARSAGTVDTIAPFLLPRGGTLRPAGIISGGEEPVSRPEVATDGFGNGVVVWFRGPVGGSSTVFAAAYSAEPPTVTRFTARKAAFSLRVDEPARVTITVRRGHRQRTKSARVHAGSNSLRFGRPMRAFLRHRGRYRATVRARDAGPRASRPRTIKFKR